MSKTLDFTRLSGEYLITEECKKSIGELVVKHQELYRELNRHKELLAERDKIIEKCFEVIEGRWTDFHINEFLNSDFISKYKEGKE